MRSPDQAFVSAVKETLTLESGFSTFSRHINRMRLALRYQQPCLLPADLNPVARVLPYQLAKVLDTR